MVPIRPCESATLCVTLRWRCWRKWTRRRRACGWWGYVEMLLHSTGDDYRHHSQLPTHYGVVYVAASAPAHEEEGWCPFVPVSRRGHM
eukprot:52183-Eustigmatos_ZCMA.PRE.1